MANFVSISEAAQATKRSTSWVRNKAKELQEKGLANRSDGKWEVDLNAILSLRGATKVDTVTTAINDVQQDWQKMVEILRADNQEIRAENRQLRAEIMALLSAKSEGGVMSWVRTVSGLGKTEK